MTPIVIALLRIKNEARWIDKVVQSIMPVCTAVIVLDDHSTDGTPEICEKLGCIVHRSKFEGIDESRDKDFLLTKAYAIVPEQWHGNSASPYWALAIDGDEVLMPEDVGLIKRMAAVPAVHAYSFKILYLWDDEQQYRADGVYGNFCRPSMFRLMNPTFRYQRTPYGNGANFHCSSVPQEMLHHSQRSEARLLHYGYLHKADRLRKYKWYTAIDPGNRAEDEYRHTVQGDVPEVPAHMTLRWAGPLQLRPLPQ